jgi:hypothetical protein
MGIRSTAGAHTIRLSRAEGNAFSSLFTQQSIAALHPLREFRDGSTAGG